MRTQLLAIVFLLSACVTPPPVIVGRYASSLSDADIQQIKLLVLKDPDLDHRICQLEVVRPDKVRVKTGGIKMVGSAWTTITMIKRRGEWLVVPNSGAEAEVERTITVY